MSDGPCLVICRRATCRRPPSRLALAVALLAALGPGGVRAGDLLHPDSAFAQLGLAEHAHTLVVGATWDWDWRRRWRAGLVTGYWEVSIGRWESHRDGPTSSAFVTQAGITPVLRYEPADDAAASWFVEAGIGANLVVPLYESGAKRFSTRFNFGNHLAVGRRFGARRGHELALRLQHFSNAGIRRPNPGENFVQLRYALYF